MLPESAARAAACHPRAWRLFLVAERCTLPLLARLSAGGAERTPLPPAVHAVLRERGTVELQRVLSAQRQLREIALIARRLGTPCVVLKGGVSVRGPRALDVADLDLLVPPEQCHAFAAGNTTNPTNNGGVPVDYAWGTALTLSSVYDAIKIARLFDMSGATPDTSDALTIDRVAYASEAISGQNGISRELKNPALDNSNMDGSNWAAAAVSATYGPGGRGTPKAQNSAFVP